MKTYQPISLFLSPAQVPSSDSALPAILPHSSPLKPGTTLVQTQLLAADTVGDPSLSTSAILTDEPPTPAFEVLTAPVLMLKPVQTEHLN